MKKLITLLIVTLLIGCSTQDAPLESKSHQKRTTQSVNLGKEIVKSWGRQKDFFIKGNFEIIGWEEAKGKLLKAKYRGGKQYHTGWLTIYNLDGNKYLTKQPRVDAYWQFMQDNGLDTKGFGTE